MANGSFVDNFTAYEFADLARYWTIFGTANPATDIQPKYGRAPGGGGLYYSSGSSTNGIYRGMPVAAAATPVLHFAIFFPSFASTNQPFFWLTDGGTPVTTGNIQVHLDTTSAGKLALYRGNGTTNLLATSTNAMSINTWYTIEAKITINNSTGAYEIRVDGTSVNWIPAATGQNTRGSTAANNSADGFAFGGNVSLTFQLTDILVANTAQSAITDFVGPGRLVACYVSGAGSHADWTPNFGTNAACVSEKQCDGDSSFNQSSTPNQIDSFAMEDVPVGATIKCVQVVHVARKDAGAARTMATFTRAGGGGEHLGTTFSLASSYTALIDMLETDLDTGSAWTAANFNAVEIGYKEIS